MASPGTSKDSEQKNTVTIGVSYAFHVTRNPMSRCYLYGLRIPQSFQTARFYSRLRSVPLIQPEASKQKNRQIASRFLLYMSGAGMKAEFTGGGGIFCDFFKIHCRSINVDSACGSVILIFSNIHCRVCYATAESGSANRHFSKIYRRSIAIDGASGSVNRDFSKIYRWDSFQAAV